MPPLQDITHRFLSPLPPSSPALSYIDDVVTVEQNRTEPSSAFLALSTSSHAHARRPGPDDDDASDKENKENMPPFELGPPHAGPSSNAAAFSTPASKAARHNSRRDDDSSPPSSDPFGFLAVERKLKLERGQGKRIRREQEPLEPSSKRQKLDLTTTTPSARVLPPAPRGAATPAKSILSPAKLKTQTPIPRRAVDPRMLSPPAASPFYMQGRRRRRATQSFSDVVDSHTSTPSPSKRREAPIHSPVPNADEDNNDTNGENTLPSPTARQKSAVPKPKSKRKRVRIAEVDDEEDVGNQTLSALAHDPEMLAAVLQSRLPKRRVRQRTGTGTRSENEKSKSKETRSRRNRADEETGEEEEDKEETKRRSVRLAVRGSRAGNKKGEESKKSTDKTRKPVRKGKGKENAGRNNLKPTSSSTKKPVSKGKEKEVDEDSDEVKEKCDRERAARRAYFNKLDSYELETENIYVI